MMKDCKKAATPPKNLIWDKKGSSYSNPSKVTSLLNSSLKLNLDENSRIAGTLVTGGAPC